MPQERALQESAKGQKKLLGGMLLLLPATVFSKVVGLFYKIPLILIVGVEGMAYFLAAYHVYSLLFVLSATGLPTALSLQVSRAVATGKRRAVRRILGVAMLPFLLLGAGGTAFLLFFAPRLAAWIAMADAAAAVVAIAPALLLAAFIGAVKGYFQGLGQMLPTAVSEVIEASGKLIFGLLLALYAKGQGASTQTVAAYAIFGITAGLLLSALLLLLWLLISLPRPGKGDETPLPKRGAVLGELLRHGLPITVSASVMSLVSLIDTALISGRLQASGMAPSAAHALYSSYGNLAVPLYNLIPALLTPLTVTLMPMISAALARGDRSLSCGVLNAARRITVLLAVPAALGMGVFAAPLLTLIYGGEAAVGTAAPLLSLLALSVLPAALICFSGAALQASGHTVTPVLAMAAGATVKLAAEYLLLPLPQAGILAAPISTLLCNLTALLIQGIALAYALPGSSLGVGSLLRAFAAALPAIAGGVGTYFALLHLLGESRWLMLPVLAVTVPIFFLLALPVGALRREDLIALPMGERLSRLIFKEK